MSININLIRDDNLFFNTEILNEMRKNAMVFNVDEKALSFLDEQLMQGKEIKIKEDEEMEVYRIDSGVNLVGVFILKKQWDPEIKEVWESIVTVK